MTNSVLRKKEKIFQLLNENKIRINMCHTIQTILKTGYCAEKIAVLLKIDRSNASRELNILFKENKVIKVSGKPVIYFSRELLENVLQIKFANPLIMTKINFIQKIKSSKFIIIEENYSTSIDIIKNISSNTQTSPKKNIFSNIIGFDYSLKEPIEQAIAAIIYPPNGLHTLLLGSTGTGKTTFAGFMYQYAVNAGILSVKSPYIIFNCADYSGNQQLLLSYLFGYIKGAFTGANQEKTGLIDEADGGILFLDEVHRLPPEGQEMLFPLIDRGCFRRLGETNNLRKVNVRLILATTENTNSVILSTFMRRIPCVISIPDLANRPLQERLNFIYNFFAEEAKKINLPITVSKEVFKLLLTYDCRGNIGQLKNDIKITCAKALVEYITEHQEQIIIKLSQIIKYFFTDKFIPQRNNKNLYDDFIFNKITTITFQPTDFTQNHIFQDSLVDSSYHSEEDFYDSILKSFSNFLEQNIPISEIKKNINLQVENYFYKYPNVQKERKQFSTNYPLIDIIDPKIINSVRNILEDVCENQDFNKNKKVIYSLALHIEALLENLKKGVIQKRNIAYNFNFNPSEDEYKLTQKIKNILETTFSVKVPHEEVLFITIFLNALKNNTLNENNFLNVIVIAHGDTTASSMVNVANELLKTTHVKALNMPLNESVQNTIKKALDIVRKLNTSRGCLFLVDMGSLTSLGDIIGQKLGIKTRTLKMVTTPMVIEAARKSMMPNISLDTLVNEVENSSKLIGNSSTISVKDVEELSTPTQTLSNQYDYFEHNEKQMFQLLKSILTFLDPKKAYTLLNKIYISLLNRLQLSTDTNFKVKFIFHNISMLERVIRNDSLVYNKADIVCEQNDFLYKIIREEFHLLENSFGIIIPNTEIAYDIDMINIFINCSYENE